MPDQAILFIYTTSLVSSYAVRASMEDTSKPKNQGVLLIFI